MFTLDDLLDATRGRIINGTPTTAPFTGGAFDSRLVSFGEVFFALRDQRDGHEFVADAFARGARAAVVERPVDGLGERDLLVQVDTPLLALRALAERLRDRYPIPAVGITGNVGKTTAKEAIAAAMGARYRVLKTSASYNNEIGVPLTFLGLEPSHEVAVIELGFYVPGEIADLCRLVRPRVGVITRIPEQPVHFARTPSVEAIASGKAELIESLSTNGTALLNADDPRVRALATRTGAHVVFFGEGANAALRASDVRAEGLEGLRFVATYEGERADVRVPLPGRHTVVAALAALGSARALGVPLEEAAVALATLEQPRHRMEVRRGDGVTVIDDSYNASPAAVMAALAVLRGVRARRIAVIGDMLELGALSADAHEEVGIEAARSSDILVGVGPLARTAVDAARRAGMGETHTVADGAEALVLLKRVVRPADVILVKGSHSLALERLADALVAPVVA